MFSRILLRGANLIVCNHILNSKKLNLQYPGLCSLIKRVQIHCSNKMDMIIKSPNDKKEYRAIKLGNGLAALLISDKHFMCDAKDNQLPVTSISKSFNDDGHGSSDELYSASNSEASDGELDAEEETKLDSQGEKNKMAAASLCVKVGSFSDPDDLPGLAHFLEHMIFMGNTKYPEENYFESFISKYGGSTNAFTDCERTVFKLEVGPKYFHTALDVFASCFVSPHFKCESMEREMEAVESEFQLNAPLDSQRKAILFGSMAKDGHPMGKFFWGNIQTLGEIPRLKNIDVHERMCEFWKRYYSAHYMTLAVCSTESLETLENWVQETFSSIPNNGLNLPSYRHLVDPFKPEKFHKLYKVIPVKKTHEVVISWALPRLEEHYRVKPLGYIGWLVGHEGNGSILAYLRKNSMALSLIAGNDESGFELNSTCSLFTVRVILTEKGMDNIFEVICLVFQYIKMLQNAGPQERIFQELKDIDDSVFRFQESIEESDYVEQLAESMQCYPPEHYLVGGRLFFDYDEQLIKSCQDALTVEDANITIMSTRFSKEVCQEVEPWTHASYSVSDIPEKWLQCLKDLDVHPEFALPPVNPFIATKFDLKNEVSCGNEYPVKILEDELSRVWYKKDLKFKVPKAYIFCHLICPVGRSSAKNAAMMDLFVSVLNQELSEVAYPAEVAGLSYAIHASESGLVVQASGFDHKLLLLFETLVDHIVNFRMAEGVFPIMKTHLLKSYYNTFIKPEKLCKDVRLSILQKVYWSMVDRKLALKDVTLEMFMDFKKECFSKIFVELLVQGNITVEETLSLNALVKNKLRPTPLVIEDFPELRAMKFPEGETFCHVPTFNAKDQNSFVTNYYQLGPGSIQTTSLMDLLMAHMNEPCFNVLRTQKQLGYDVSSSMRNSHGVIGFIISVKSCSDKFNCLEIDQNIEEFLHSFAIDIEKLKEEDYKIQLVSLINTKKCEDLNLEEEVRRNWSEVLSVNYVFDRLKKEIEFLQNVTMDYFKLWCRDIIGTDKNKRRKLGIQVDGSNKKASEDCSHYIYDDATNDCDEIKTAVDFERDNDADDKKIHTLSFLFPQENNKSQIFIRDINDYKTNLIAYPVWRIAS